MEAEVIAFFEEHACELVGLGGSGSSPKLPEFELLPRDFIEFAERDLKAGGSTYSLVNATSNLKRAIDCQLDYILVVLNLDKLYREKRLGVDRKLGFLKKAGIFRSRSIEKLNVFRNRLEHHYEVPDIEDVEVYFDLVSAFVNVVEATIPALGWSASQEMRLEDGGIVSTEFEFEGPAVEVNFRHGADAVKQVYRVDISTSPDVVAALDSFSFLLRVHLLLRKLDDGAIGERHFLAALKGEVQV